MNFLSAVVWMEFSYPKLTFAHIHLQDLNMSFLHLFFKKFSAVLLVDPSVCTLAISDRNTDLDPERISGVHIMYNAFRFLLGLRAYSWYIWWVIVPIELMLMFGFDWVVVLVVSVCFGQIRNIRLRQVQSIDFLSSADHCQKKYTCGEKCDFTLLSFSPLLHYFF